MDRTRAVNRFKKSSQIDSWTNRRDPAMHACPWLWYAANRDPWTAAARSASAKTMFGPFPPSSRRGFFSVSAPARMMSCPTSTDPVKQIFATSGWRASLAPATEPFPGGPDRVALDRRRHAAEIFEPVDGPHEIESTHVADRMTGVPRLDLGEGLPVLLDHPRELQQEPSTVLRREGAPRSVEGFPRRVDGRVDVGRPRFRDLRVDFVGVRIVNRKGLARGRRDESRSEERRV